MSLTLVLFIHITPLTSLLFKDLVTYEYNSLKTLLDNKKREITTSFNPKELTYFLSRGKLPKDLKSEQYAISIVPDTTGNESMMSVFHS